MVRPTKNLSFFVDKFAIFNFGLGFDFLKIRGGENNEKKNN